ncbi:hypothetical protein Golax_007777, partial [Gossypium laxum]|nr:hypothetical protein [Gossypium laxum]
KLKDSKPTNPGVFTIYHSGKQWDLSDNSLTAPVPKFLANLKLLSVLNLSRNMFNGSIPAELMERANQDEEITPICKSDSCKSSSNKNNSKVIPVVASVALVVVLVLKTDVVDSRKTNQLQGSLKNRQFTHAQLKRMTNNFGRVVGKGGFGTVYVGVRGSSRLLLILLEQQASRLGEETNEKENRNEACNSAGSAYVLTTSHGSKACRSTKTKALIPIVGVRGSSRLLLILLEQQASRLGEETNEKENRNEACKWKNRKERREFE